MVEPKLVFKFKGTAPEDQEVERERSGPVGFGAAMAASESMNTSAATTTAAINLE